MLKSIGITTDAYNQLCTTVGNHPPESGAIIGAEENNPTVITRVWFDADAGIGKKVYHPSGEKIESTVQMWYTSHGSFVGIVHSHSDHAPFLSHRDIQSAVLVMKANKLPYVVLGLFCQGHLSMFCVSEYENAPRVKPLEIVIL